jgi:predicted DNA repair protein MutK
MAGASLFTLIDDIATLLDDIAVMSKVAAKKTAGVLGDDLALNAQQVAGVSAERELPVVWAVARGSFVNKAILVPAALAISVWLPWLITPLLMLGGAYLCFEGCEKLLHAWLHRRHGQQQHEQALRAAISDPAQDMLAFERDKIRGAIRTDFILSAEIIVIALGTVAHATFGQQVAVLTTIALLMTIGVYGLVAGIVKLDDAGLHLIRQAGSTGQASFRARLGRVLVQSAPYLMKFLSVAGTIAMFSVGGSILLHGLAPLHALIAHAGWLITLLADIVTGIVAGSLLVAVMQAVARLRHRPA